MTLPPLPVVFEPIFKPKPWGGRRLATLLGKRLPGSEPIGESWELADLPGNESRVRGGPLAGKTLGQLVQTWGPRLLGDAVLVDGRFPLLVKFLDACENVSVQVHPKPPDPPIRAPSDSEGGEIIAPSASEGDSRRPGPSCQSPSAALPAPIRAPSASEGSDRMTADEDYRLGVKHEAWYVVHANPGSKLYIGLKPGVGPDEVRRAANTPGLPELLQTWKVEPGECYYLPSGTPHALGAGVVVAEIQTSSDVTYRLYDWGRVGLDGRPRELHIEQALANIRHDVTAEMIRQTPSSAQAMAEMGAAATRICTCDRFTIDRTDLSGDSPHEFRPGRMIIFVALVGTARLLCDNDEFRFGAGDVVLVPAGCTRVRAEAGLPCRCLVIGATSR